MKIMIKVLMILLILLMSNLFLFKGLEGDASLPIQNPLPSSVTDFFDFRKWGKDIKKVSGKAVGNEHAGQTKVYQWRNQGGGIQFSNVPPPVEEYEVIWVDPDVNLMQGLKPQDKLAQDQPGAKNNMPSPLTISPDKVKKLVQDAKNIQKLSDDRAKALEQL